MPNALPFRTAKQLAAAVRQKKIGCLELLDLYLKRIEAHIAATGHSLLEQSGQLKPSRLSS